MPNWSVESVYCVASKPSAANVYGWPVNGLTVGLNVDGPKPFQTGWNGVSVCVRSMYFDLLRTSL